MNERDDLSRSLSDNLLVRTDGVVRNWLNLTAKRIRGRAYWAKDQVTIARLKHASIAKKEFVNDIKAAISAQAGYAAGKIGRSQKHWMYYEVLLAKEKNPEKVREFEEQLKFHALNQEGIFPVNFDFYLRFNRFYMEHLKNLNCLGIFYDPPAMEMELIRHYKLKNKFIYFVFQEPDWSIPCNEDKCYFPFFRDKKILIVCPFAEFLKERATKEIYENAWSKIGKKWFSPKCVEAVEFPYGFSPDTHKRYSTVLDLFEEIIGHIQKRNFDIALIGAGGLAIPVASFVKSLGKLGIDLGGALQFSFGVSGKRWKDWEKLKQNYFNEWWTYVPSRYRPKEQDVCDGGAYW